MIRNNTGNPLDGVEESGVLCKECGAAKFAALSSSSFFPSPAGEVTTERHDATPSVRKFERGMVAGAMI
jgi:hypothetical protein